MLSMGLKHGSRMEAFRISVNWSLKQKEDQGPQGLCHLIVEREVSPYEAKELPKLGMRSCPTAELYFNNCRVPKENLLVPPGEGLRISFGCLRS